MSKMSNDDFSNKSIKFGCFKIIKINNIDILVQRLSYVGEIGFELYIDMKSSKEIFNLIVEKGKEFNLSLCGVHTMDTMRMETGYLHWGHDISPEENQYQAGLSFAVSFKKDINFIGKDALVKLKENKPSKKLIMLTLINSKPGKPLLLHDEPIYFDDKIVGRTTSGNYSFCFEKNLTFGYVKMDQFEQKNNKKVYIEVEKKKYEAEIILNPLNAKDIRN